MNRRWKDIDHLLRMAAVFAAGLLVFAVVRTLAVPADFGVIGHYRASAPDIVRARPIAFAGQKACVECHTDVAETRASGGHARASCEGCHGPLARHAAAEEGAPSPVKPDGRAVCLPCHTAHTGKPAKFPQVVVREHADEGACTACHNPHQPMQMAS
jgi:cytochrome c3-like protein